MYNNIQMNKHLYNSAVRTSWFITTALKLLDACKHIKNSLEPDAILFRKIFAYVIATDNISCTFLSSDGKSQRTVAIEIQLNILETLLLLAYYPHSIIHSFVWRRA